MSALLDTFLQAAAASTWLPWVGLALLVIAVVELWLKNRTLPPGPWTLPIFGYYFFFGEPPYLTLTDMFKKYGEIFSFRTLGGNRIIVLNGMSLIKEVLISRADEFIGRPLEMNFLKWLDDGYGITQEEGEVWKEQRKFFINAAKSHGFGKMDIEGFAHEQLQQAIADIRSSKETSIDLFFHMEHVSGNIISVILSGKKLSKHDPVIRELCKKLNEIVLFFADRRIFLLGYVFEYFYLKFHPEGRRMNKTKRFTETYTNAIVEEHMKTLDPAHPRDFIDSYLIHLKNLKQKGQLNETSFSVFRLKKVFYGMFIEGLETPSSTAYGLLLELANHPEEQKIAQKEIDSVVGHERLPSWQDKKNLPYTDALILELFRTNVVFGISTYYSNFKETEIRGYRIPKRSIIVANLYSISSDPKIYPNPKKFDPKRFLAEDGQRSKQTTPIPFGIGRRSCIAESLGSMEVFWFISAILQNFMICPAENGKLRLEPR